MRVPPNIIGNPHDEIKFPYKLLLTNIQLASPHKYFTNNLPVSIKLSKTRLSMMIKLEGILGRLLGPLLNFTINITITINKKM